MSVNRLVMSRRCSGLALSGSALSVGCSWSSVTAATGVDGVDAADCCLSDAGTAVVISLLTTGSSGDFSSKELSSSSSSSGVDFSSTLL